ncbi:hypothetical protein [Acinetobacter sp. MB5]|uniref:hypothetical protein n=1 Tax=Acinetobacter sp. MB5 TaxID=2069438 RepID=UPI000DCF7109|nr:hypothetical protein [Acinetobacter sp. MB5]
MPVKLGRSMLMLVLLIAGCHQSPSEQHQEEPEPHTSKTNVISLCSLLSQQMQNINNSSSIQDLQYVNQQLQKCLPQIPMAERQQLLYASTSMYQRFLASDRSTEEQRAFDQYAMSGNAVYSTSYLSEMSPRDRYLIQNQGNAAYYEVYDSGDTGIMYRRQPQYLLHIFAPYLPKAEQFFIEHLAAQNQFPILSGNSFNASWSELSKRALFWQNYVNTYPNSALIDDAQRLKFKYAQFLFHGVSNIPVSTNYVGEDSIYPEALEEIKYLATQDHSNLGLQAKKFLRFIHIAPSQRDQDIPVELSPTEQRSAQSNTIKAIKQLDRYIGLYDPLTLDSTHINRDCLSDAICITHPGKVANTLVSKQQF